MAAAIIFMIAAPVHAETYQYDDLNRLTKVNYDNGTVVEYTYDAAGNMLTSTTIPGLEVNEAKAANGIVSGKAVPGSTIKVLSGGTELGTTTAGEARTFSITLANLQNKQALIVQALNEGQVFAEVSITVGGEAEPNPEPTEPVSPKVGTIDDASSNIVGTADPGTTVKIYSNGEVIGTGTADEEGVFTIELPEEVQAGHKLEVVTENHEGIESEPTEITVISKDERTAKLAAESISVTNNQTLIDDEIEITNLTAGDKVKVYRTKTGTEVLAQQTVPEGQTSVKLKVEELGREAGSIFVSVTSEGKEESELTEVQYNKEPGGKEGCVLTSIAHGTKFAAALPALQSFRDDVLMKSSAGQAIVKAYYNISPSLIGLIH